MKDFYPEVGKIRYEGAATDNPLAFRHYNPEALIAGRTMREHLRFAMSYWHTMVAEGSDMFGVGTVSKKYGSSDPMQQARHKALAAFELMDKLDLDYYCFHDRDIAPEADHLAETNKRLDEMASLLAELQKEYGKKVLWGTANLFSHPRYRHGAATACSADVFAFAAAQVKKALELTVQLHGAGYVFWGGREGYETLLNTNMAFELDNLARLMRMAVDYGRSIGFQGDFYVEPKPKEPTKHQYDFDATAVIGFLRQYGLDKDFKLNIEANHATLAGHSFQHELRTARVNGMLGSIDANQGDQLLGWDTDQFPTNVYEATWCMFEVLKDGGFKLGGLNFDAKTRRASSNLADIFHGYIAGMDTFALGLKLADRVIRDGRLDRFIQERYASWQEGIGKRILDGTATISDLEAYVLVKGDVATGSGHQEYLENLINQMMFTE